MNLSRREGGSAGLQAWLCVGPASHSSGPKKQMAGGQTEGPPQPDTPTPSARMASVTGTPAARAVGPRAMELGTTPCLSFLICATGMVPVPALLWGSQGWGGSKACGTAPARHLLLHVVSIIMLVVASGSFLPILFQFLPLS